MKTQNPIQTFMLHVSPSQLSNPQTPFPVAPGMLRRLTLIQLVTPQATPFERKKKNPASGRAFSKTWNFTKLKFSNTWNFDSKIEEANLSHKKVGSCAIYFQQGVLVSSHHNVQSEAVACLVRLWLRSWIWQEVIQGTSIEISRHFKDSFSHN